MPAAEADLVSIRAYLRRENARAADRVGARLFEACTSLAHAPSRGRPGRSPGTRELTIVWPYVIVYRITHPSVQVLRIWHGRQARPD